MVENRLSGRRRANAELVLFLADAEAFEPTLHGERGDPLVAFGEVSVREDDVQTCLGPIGDPELAAVQDPLVTLLRGLGRESERIRPRSRLRERVGTDEIGGKPWQVALLGIVGRPLEQQRVHKRILHVHEDRSRCIDGRQLFDREHGHEQAAAGSAVRLGNLDPHEAELEELGNQGGIELRRLLHRLHARADLALGEVSHRALKHPFFFGERGKRVHAFLSDGPSVSISRIPPSDPSTPVASYGM